MYKKSFLRPTAVGELRSGDMVAIDGCQLTAWGIDMLASAQLWALYHFEVLKVMHCYLGDDRTTSLCLRTRSSAVTGERHQGWLVFELQRLEPKTTIEMIKPTARPLRRFIPSAFAETLTPL